MHVQGENCADASVTNYFIAIQRAVARSTQETNRLSYSLRATISSLLVQLTLGIRLGRKIDGRIAGEKVCRF